MTEQIFTYLSIIIWVVLITMWVTKVFKQPIIIWYIIAGTILSIAVPNILHENFAIETFSSIWIAFLLFIVWLELNPKIIKDIWKTAISTWFLQVLITTIIWFFIGILLWFEKLTSLYLAVWFAFSSTIVILKLLSDKWNTDTVFGKLSIWILIVQDLIVMLLFIAISTIKQIQNWWDLRVIAILTLKIVWLTVGLFVISKYILPIATKKIAESQEYLFLFSIWWCLILWSIFYILWFSLEIWALVAWMTLANSQYKFEIMSKIKPLRDFFVVIFFVLLGSRIAFPIETKFILPIIIFSIFVMLIKPIITTLILWFKWHTKKNSFLTWISLGQISEFSFILVMIGISMGHIKTDWILSFVTIIWLITITFSSYWILYEERVFNIAKKLWIIKFLPGKQNKTNKIPKHKYEIILIWYWRFWQKLFDSIQKKSTSQILVIDSHPEIISSLESRRIPCVYWDAWEIDLRDEIDTQKIKMIISTIKDYDSNRLILKHIKQKNPDTIIMIISHNNQEALNFYENWADYVILPHHIWADYASGLLESYWFDIKKFILQKEEQLKKLK